MATEDDQVRSPANAIAMPESSPKKTEASESARVPPDNYDSDEDLHRQDVKDFHQRLRKYLNDKGTDFRLPRFYGNEVNLLKLWKVVSYHGGYDKVTGGKLWRSVGDHFNPPRSCTTLSWSFRSFYEKLLLDFERHNGVPQIQELGHLPRSVRQLTERRGRLEPELEGYLCGLPPPSAITRGAGYAVGKAEEGGVAREGKAGNPVEEAAGAKEGGVRKDGAEEEGRRETAETARMKQEDGGGAGREQQDCGFEGPQKQSKQVQPTEGGDNGDAKRKEKGKQEAGQGASEAETKEDEQMRSARSVEEEGGRRGVSEGRGVSEQHEGEGAEEMEGTTGSGGKGKKRAARGEESDQIGSGEKDAKKSKDEGASTGKGDDGAAKGKGKKDGAVKMKELTAHPAVVWDVGEDCPWVRINVRCSPECFEIYALVPGLLREEIKVSVEEPARVTLVGQPENEDNPWGIRRFKKIILLPSPVIPNEVEAVVSLHGQMYIRLPLAPAPFQPSKKHKKG